MLVADNTFHYREAAILKHKSTRYSSRTAVNTLKLNRASHCLPENRITSAMALHTSSLFVSCVLVALCSAKFEHNYDGIASGGVQSCIINSDFTEESITLRDNCRDAYACIMSNLANSDQSILSSGSSILALVGIPTLRHEARVLNRGRSLLLSWCSAAQTRISYESALDILS